MTASFYDLLKYGKTGIANAGMSEFDKLRALAAVGGGLPISTISGVPPLAFLGQGDALTDYQISGNMTMPTGQEPGNMINPQECGEAGTGSYVGQYYISILCGGQISIIYLAEPIRKIGDYVDVAGLSIGGARRKIKKYVLDGSESWYKYEASNVKQFYTSGLNLGAISGSSALSNIAPYGVTSATRASYDHGCYIVGGGYDVGFQMWGSDYMFSDLDDWRTYLDEQYTNGTPVCFWYVLAEEETETATMPTITTANGSNTLKIWGDVKPSSISITGHIKQ